MNYFCPLFNSSSELSTLLEHSKRGIVAKLGKFLVVGFFESPAGFGLDRDIRLYMYSSKG